MANVAYNQNFDDVEALETTLATAMWAKKIEKESWFRDAIEESLNDPDEGISSSKFFTELRKKYGLLQNKN